MREKERKREREREREREGGGGVEGRRAGGAIGNDRIQAGLLVKSLS